MNLKSMKRLFNTAREPGSTILPIVGCSLEVKVKSKDRLYYTAEAGYVKHELEKEHAELSGLTPNSEALENFIEREARRFVLYVLGQLSEHGGWWFEDRTVWLSKDEVGNLFADIGLIHQNGAISD